MTYTAILLFLICLPNFIIGCLVLIQNIHNKRNRSFASFVLAVFGWSLFLGLFISSKYDNQAINYAHVYYVAAALIATSFVYFSYYFTNNNTRVSIVRHCAIIIPTIIVVGISLSETFLIQGVIHHSWGRQLTFNIIGYLIYSIFFTVFVVFGFFNLVKRQKYRGEASQYNRMLILSLVIAFVLGAVFNLLLPALGNYKYIWVGPLFTLVYIIATSYSILTHRLFDVRLALTRSLVYIFTVGVLAIVYGAVAFGIGGFFINSNTSLVTQRVFYIAVAVILAVTFQSLKKFFDRISNRIFYRDAYDPQVFISQLNQHLVSDIHLNSLLRKCSEVIIANLKVEFCSFGLKQTENLPQQIIGSNKKHFKQSDIDKVRALTPTMHKKIIVTDDLDNEDDELKALLTGYDIGALARLTTNVTDNKEGIGYIVLGYKKSGSSFNSADSAVLEIIANELVIAIQNAMQFEEIQQFNITLQKKVEEATHELQRSNKKLVALDEAKDEFISMASHQLRTPLTSVKGYISMLMDGDFGKIDKKQKDVLKDAFVSSQRMVFLIADFLNVSRLKTGKFIIEPEEVYLPDVVQEEINQLKEMAVSRNLSLEYEAPSDFPKVMLDENKIRQVMMNFVDNAIYYTPAGGKVKVELYATSTDVIYKVVDNGIGVPKAEQHRLFTKFFRAKNAQKARPDGTGLGIFMAQKVIVGQAGNVIFESTENKGSTFGFSFPLSKIKVTDKR